MARPGGTRVGDRLAAKPEMRGQPHKRWVWLVALWVIAAAIGAAYGGGWLG